MTHNRSHRNDTLGSYLEQAAHDLARAGEPLGDDAEGLLFLGAWHQSYPAILVRDPFLSDSAKLQFLYLMQESSQHPRGAIAMPSLTETARVLGHGRRTVHRDRTLLRICRWISQHKRVRDGRGRYCGSINAIHGEPCSLADANRLDRTYLELLNRSNTDDDPFLRNAGRAALASIDEALKDGRDPLEPPDSMSRRIDAAKAVQGGDGSFFDLLMPESGSIAKQHDPKEGGHTVASQAEPAKSALGDADTAHPSADFGVKSTGHTVASDTGTTKFALGDPSANFALGLEATENKKDNKSYPQNAKSALGPTTSSSSSKTTTTTKDRNLDCACEAAPNSRSDSTLQWPEKLPANERTLIERSLVSMQLTDTQCQDVLDALARKLQDPDNPMRSPVGYAVALCKRVRAGTFQPVGAPPRQSDTGAGDRSETRGPQGELNELRRQIHNLQSEIRCFDDNLIPFADTARQPDLKAQRDRLCEECGALKKHYKALRGEDRLSSRKLA